MIITNKLTASQTTDIARLEADCKKYEPLQGSLFQSSDLNFDPELPCFYLLYHPDKDTELIAFLSVFAPSPNEAELYACTAPACRRQGCFSTLLKQALLTLRRYHISDILFVHEPASTCCAAVLEKLHAAYQYSEHLMTRRSLTDDYPILPDNLSLFPANKSDLGAMAKLHAVVFQYPVEASRQLLVEMFSSPSIYAKKLISKDKQKLIGFCFFSAADKAMSIFTVTIHPQHRRKGYATAMLKALFCELLKTHPTLPITLEVNSLNTAACSLYKKLGFHITAQVDYSCADCEELLKLFA